MEPVFLLLLSWALRRVNFVLDELMVGYISRSVAGSYDNEAIAIFLLMFTFFLWIRALKTGSAFWGALTALFYFYMVSAWGIVLKDCVNCRWIRLHH